MDAGICRPHHLSPDLNASSIILCRTHRKTSLVAIDTISTLQARHYDAKSTASRPQLQLAHFFMQLAFENNMAVTSRIDRVSFT